MLQVINASRHAQQKALGLDWLTGDSEMIRLIRAKNWSETPIGPVEQWSPSLRMMVSFMLANRFPLLLWWGPKYIQIYNDSYRAIPGAKHPRSLGQRACECWREIWHILQPLIDTPFNGGPATWSEDLELEMLRSSFMEETHFTVAYSRVPDETAPGGIGGVLATVHEITGQIVSARRVAILRDLSGRAMEAKTAEESCVVSAEILAANSKDIPFALMYLLDPSQKEARLQGTAGAIAGQSATPLIVELQDTVEKRCAWPLNEALRTEQMVIVENIGRRFSAVPRGPWSDPPHTAVVLPIRSNKAHEFVGFLIAGVSSRLALDDQYRSFFELVATQIATAIANARAFEEERKRAEALAEIDRAKTAFFSNVSHEFRTPLTLMLGPVDDLLAKSHTNLSPATKSQLELVSRNGSRLLRLVNTLLDFSRIEAGRMQAVYQPTDLSAFTVELASVFRSATDKAGLQLELDCPKLGEPVFVDPDMWEKIVLNLISNAFKFTFEGAITIALAIAGNNVELRVSDTGVGIPEREIPRLFDRFYRVENTRSRTHEGSGIGLALVQELVKLHGGSLRVQSVVGTGSTFIVSVPLGSAHLPSGRIGGIRTLSSTAVGAAPFVEEALRWLPETSTAETEVEVFPGDEFIPIPCPPFPSGNSAFGKRPLILVADDNSDMRQYLLRLMEERYEVQTVADGQLALAAVRQRRPDLVLTDVMMPNLDGFALLRELRSDPKTRTIPIILLSARAGEESRVEGMQQGADDYLIKPFSARELLARVQTHLAMARIRQEAEDALRRRTEQFETLLNEAPLAVYLVDGDLRIRAVNPLATRAFGNIRNLVGRDFDDLIHIIWPEAYANEIVERFRRTLATGEPYFVPERIEERLDRGVREIYEWQINRITLPEGGHGVVCYFRDISRLVEAREAIAASEQRLRLATDAAALGIWHWRLDEDVVNWENDRPYEIFGRTAEDGPITAAEFRARVCHPEDLPSFERALSHSRETGASLFFQGRIHHKDGACRWVEFTGQPEHRTDGSCSRMLGIVLDITERKQAEETLRKSHTELEQRVDERTRRLAETVAALRTEIEKRTMTEQQLRELSARVLRLQDEERRRIARDLHDSTGQTLTVLKMILASFVPVVEGVPKAAGLLCDLQALADQAVQEVRSTSYLLHPPLLDELGLASAAQWYVDGFGKRSGISSSLELTDIPPLGKEDALVLFRVLQEGLTNVLRHSGSKAVKVGLNSDGNKIILSIQDHGRGIPSEKLECFLQTGAGIGVGLGGMKQRLEQIGGQLRVESDAKGTCVTAILPGGAS